MVLKVSGADKHAVGGLWQPQQQNYSPDPLSAKQDYTIHSRKAAPGVPSQSLSTDHRISRNCDWNCPSSAWWYPSHEVGGGCSNILSHEGNWPFETEPKMSGGRVTIPSLTKAERARED